MKMNITFFYGNNILNIFSSNYFFKKRNIFLGNDEKTFLECTTILQEKGLSYTKNEYNLFHHKLDAKYFHVTQFFRKKQVSL